MSIPIKTPLIPLLRPSQEAQWILPPKTLILKSRYLKLVISTATSSWAVGALSFQASFLHHFHREEAEFKHGDQYMIVMNDPVILERARNMLGVKAILLNVF